MKLTKEIKGKLHEYFRVKLGAFDYRGSWMKSKCPFCGRDLKFGINLSDNRTHCFRCGKSPSPIDLVIHLEGSRNYSDALRILEKEDYQGYSFKEEKVELRERKEIYLPEGFKLITMGKSQLAKSARAYVKKRGFTIKQAEDMGWGYGTEGKYFGYLIMPFRERGQLVYFNARIFMGNGPRYNNPENTTSGLSKSQLWYNSDALDMYDTVYICEGLIDAATMGVRGISSSGKAISLYQKCQLIKSQVQKVVILLDPDAKKKAIELAIELVDHKQVKVCFLPEGTDCNKLGKTEVLKIVRNTPYMNYQQLLQLKHEI